MKIRFTFAAALAAFGLAGAAAPAAFAQDEAAGVDLLPPTHEITLGWKGEVARDAVLEIGLVENVITFDNSPDFGVHGGFSYRL